MTNPAPRSTEIVTARMSQAAIDAGLRQFMISVYNYMASGLSLTGIVAYAAAETGLYASLIDTRVLFWGVTLAPLALVLFLSFRIEKMSLGTAKTAFWAYAALVGLSLSGIFFVYTGTSIARTFFITAATFLAMSLFGYTTRADLARTASFLLMGLVSIITEMRRPGTAQHVASRSWMGSRTFPRGTCSRNRLHPHQAGINSLDCVQTKVHGDATW